MAENNTFPSQSASNDDYTNTSGTDIPETAGWHSPTQGGITTPIAPEGGIPAYPGNETGSPDSFPTRPDLPTFPNYPNLGYGQVRFINASTNTFPVIFSIDGTVYTTGSRFGNVSPYQGIADGFHTISVNRATGMQALLLQQTFPFIAGQKVTMVLVDAKEGGLDLLQIADTTCSNVPAGYGCYRVANVSYSGSAFDISLYNGDTVFRNVGFKDVTAYKRGLAGNSTFYMTNACFYTMPRELSVILIGAVTVSSPIASPLASANVTIQAGRNTTSYIMGNTWSSYGLRMVTVDD